MKIYSVKLVEMSLPFTTREEAESFCKRMYIPTRDISESDVNVSKPFRDWETEKEQAYDRR
jgi:hypothetical protein